MEPTPADLAKQAGQSIYRDGLLASGLPLRAIVQKGVVLNGGDAACVKCHRRSGLGGSEGQNTIRPIAGKLLFSPVQTETRWRAAPAGGTVVRPAYTQATLARALREGVDPAGRVLNALMPRYALSDADIAQLHAYLEGLSSPPAPGVTDKAIHFSTVITPDVHPDKRHAMLEVLQAFFSDKNGGTRQETRRRELGRKQMYRAYRTWVLHPWVLSGSPETWREQLAAYYRQQPVFAVIGGIGGGNWQPVHAFCEAFEVPCVFPDVDYPDVSGTGYYPLYYTRGVTLEAEVLAKHLLQAGQGGKAGTVVQVYRDHALGRLPAQALRDALQRHGGKTVIDYPLTDAGRMPAEFLTMLSRNESPYVLVVWLDSADLDALELTRVPPASLTEMYVSASLSAMRRPDLPEPWLSKLHMVYPFDLPTNRNLRLARMKAWLQAKNIPFADERTQANAFFAATVTGEAMSHLGENFSRDYFIERIEQMTQNALSPSIYPHLSLGPGQRFASKGGYVVRFLPETKDTPEAISEWLVP
jgi:Periplasmic binding protein/Cytochrome c